MLQGIRDYLPESGLTQWDAARRILWTPAGVIVAGTSGLGVDRAPFTMSFNEQLSLRWLTTHERRNSEEALLDMVATENGLLCVGYSAQYFDVVTHAVPPADNACALFMKLPFDGKVPLHRAAGGIDRFLHPVVHDTVAALDDITIVSPTHMYQGTISLSLLPATQATAAGFALGPLSPVAFTGWAPLEIGDANQPMTYAQWAAYQQLPAGSTAGDDFDGDGRTNGQEYFFGGDPFTIQSAKPTLTIGRFPGGGLYLETTRSQAAGGQSPFLESSINLQDWLQVLGAGWYVSGSDPAALGAIIRHNLPAGGEPQKFFRAGAP